MSYILGVNLLPSTGEFTYDTIAYLGQRVTESTLTSINRYANGGPNAGTGTVTDYTIAIDNLQAQFPDCTTVSLVVSWFGNSTDVTACQIYPSTTYIGGSFQQASAGVRCLALLGADAERRRASSRSRQSGGSLHLRRHAVGPVDRALHRRFEVARLPRRILSVHADDGGGPAVARAHRLRARMFPAPRRLRSNAFLGAGGDANSRRDADNLTVAYSGSSTDYTYRRMILHYANLCVVAGGVDLFLLGSEFRGLETIRGPAWTKAGTTAATAR